MAITAARSRPPRCWPCSTSWVSSRRTRGRASLMTTPSSNRSSRPPSTARNSRRAALPIWKRHAPGAMNSCAGTTLIIATAASVMSRPLSATQGKTTPSWQLVIKRISRHGKTTPLVGQGIRATGHRSVLSRSIPSETLSSVTSRLKIKHGGPHESGDNYLDLLRGPGQRLCSPTLQRRHRNAQLPSHRFDRRTFRRQQPRHRFVLE